MSCLKYMCDHEVQPGWYHLEWGDSPPAWARGIAATEPCPDCAVRDWKAMQALRNGYVSSVGKVYDKNGDFRFVAHRHDDGLGVAADPADAILGVM